MFKFINKQIFLSGIVIFLLISLSIISYIIYTPKPLVVIEMRRDHDYNIVNIESYEPKSFKTLQMHGQSYKETEDYLYIYGERGFTYIDLHTAEVYSVLRDNLSSASKAYVKNYYKIGKPKEDAFFKIYLIDEDELDSEKRQIMEELKKVEIPNPGYHRIYIYDKDLRK